LRVMPAAGIFLPKRVISFSGASRVECPHMSVNAGGHYGSLAPTEQKCTIHSKSMEKHRVLKSIPSCLSGQEGCEKRTIRPFRAL
jgi:hypothetical protein